MDDLVLRLIIVGGVLSVVSGPVGSIILWRRLAFFGDTIAHSALMAVAFSILFHVPSALMITLICFLFAAILSLTPLRSKVSFDTVLSVMAHGSLALGLVLLALVGNSASKLTSLLFGDILAISSHEVWVMVALGIAVLLVLKLLWQRILMMLISEELAHTENINVPTMRFVLSVILGLTIGILVQIVGVLLVVALLVIPAAATRRHVLSPGEMIVGTSLITGISYLIGSTVSFFHDVPTGAMIVLCALACYIISQLIPERRG